MAEINSRRSLREVIRRLQGDDEDSLPDRSISLAKPKQIGNYYLPFNEKDILLLKRSNFTPVENSDGNIMSFTKMVKDNDGMAVEFTIVKFTLREEDQFQRAMLFGNNDRPIRYSMKAIVTVKNNWLSMDFGNPEDKFLKFTFSTTLSNIDTPYMQRTLKLMWKRDMKLITDGGLSLI